MKQTFYVTTPIYYSTQIPHLGNAYTSVAADAIARHYRQKGVDTYFLTGMDEHGLKVQTEAKKANCDPKSHVDFVASQVKEIWNALNVQYDGFIRTTDKPHILKVQQIFKHLYDKGDIYKNKYTGKYCVPCETFLTQTQLVDGKCPDCGRDVIDQQEECYFFKMSNYADRLAHHIETHPDFIQPETRKNEMLSFIRGGLDDLCVSRTSFTWGVPVTFDPGHVVYVWVDALSNYITALGYPDGELYNKFWPADVHLVGKDIIRFHTIIWPSILMSLELPLPKQIFAHGFLMLNGGKMSKSKGNVIDPVVLSQHFGEDCIRYFMLREVPFGSDGNFTNVSFINRINSDLVNDLGNLLSRTTAMVEKYFAGRVTCNGVAEDIDAQLIDMAQQVAEVSEQHIEKLLFSSALTEIWKFISRANKYIDETMPWKLAKDESSKPRLERVLYNLCESLRVAAALIQPYTPRTAERIRRQINNFSEDKAFDQNGEYAVQKGEALFPRLDLEKELQKINELSELSI